MSLEIRDFQSLVPHICICTSSSFTPTFSLEYDVLTCGHVCHHYDNNFIHPSFPGWGEWFVYPSSVEKKQSLSCIGCLYSLPASMPAAQDLCKLTGVNTLLIFGYDLRGSRTIDHTQNITINYKVYIKYSRMLQYSPNL